MIIIILIIFVLCAYALWRNQTKDLNEPPQYPGAWPVIGHILSLIGRKNLWNYIQQVAVDLPKREGVSYVMIGPIKAYVVCDLDASMLLANQCLDKSVYYKFSEPWMGDSLLTSNGAVWKKDSKMLMSAFSHHVFGEFLNTFNKEARLLVDQLLAEAGNVSFDHVPYMKDYAINTLSKSVLGIDIPNKKKYINMTENLMYLIIKRFLNTFLHSDIIYNWTNLKKTEDDYTNFFHTTADKMIQEKKSEVKGKLTSNSDRKRNFLELLIDISTRETMSDKQMNNHLNLMIAAGFDTISVTLSIVLVMIGSHKSVQNKIYEEINEVLCDKSKDIEQFDLDRMVYLEAVIKESMRVFPTAPVIAREIKEDIKLEKYTLYAGNSCLLLLTGLNLHPIWGDDAQHFKPERWLEPSTLPDHPAVYAGFSIGRRNCIGKYYAMMSMKTLLVNVVQNYVIAADWTKVEFGFDMITRLLSGHHISLQKRT